MKEQLQGSRSSKSGILFFSHTPQKFSWLLLTVFIFLAYAPFLGSRVVRPAGDDKVYVSQSLEMARDGHWFMQSLANEPNYFKGPLHYILVRIGIFIFGTSMWATVYMNLFFLILGGIALGSIVHRNMKDFEGWSFWAGVAFALCAGIYSHAFASQMEVETAGLFCLGLYFLDRAGPGKPDLHFWLVAGIVGWLKSPLHSVLLGSTAIIFWAMQGELWPRMKSAQAWGAVCTGILLCTLGYLPAFLLDRQNFIDSYVLRETWYKPANGSQWHYPVVPFFTYSVLPWMFPAFVTYIDGVTRIFRRSKNIRTTPGAKRVLWLGICLMIPSIVFFILHPYRGQNYNLPVMGGLVLFICAIWATRSDTWQPLYSFSMMLTTVLCLAVPVLITIVTEHYEPMPFWWPGWLLPTLWLGCFFSMRGLWREGFTFQQMRPASMARRTIWLFLAIGSLTMVLGEREMVDVRMRLQLAKVNNEKLHLSYYNLQKDIWSEWGYLNFMIPYPVRGLFNEADLQDAIKKGDLILIPGDKFLDEFKNYIAKQMPVAKLDVQPWRRWKTKGKNAEGIPLWKESWEKKDFSVLERPYYMVRVL